MIRPASTDDAAQLSALYNPYVLETTISFEEEAVTVDEMRRRISEVTAHLPWLVLEEGGRILGYAYATRWRTRSAYRFTAESTVYLERGQTRKGLGTLLYGELVAEVRRRGLHTLIGGIAQPNAASVALHEKLGFRRVALFDEVGFKFGKRVGVGYWQLML